MRNYVQVFAMSWDIHDDVDPDIIIGVLNKFFNDAEDGAAFAQTLGPQFTLQEGYGSRWVLLDKAAIVFALNSQATFANSANIQFEIPNVENLPDWPNNDGNPKGPTYNKHLGDEKRFGKADFSGATSLFTFAQQLGLVSRAILSLRNPVGGKLYAQRIAGIVLAIQSNIFALRITVTEGSNQFHDLVLANRELFAQIG